MPKKTSTAKDRETKPCPYCAEEILLEAKKCKHCHEILDEDLRQQSKEYIQQFNPAVAAILSLFIPGAGQIYKGKFGEGLIWLIAVVIGYFFLIFPGLILHLVCIASAASDPRIDSAQNDAENKKYRNQVIDKETIASDNRNLAKVLIISMVILGVLFLVVVISGN